MIDLICEMSQKTSQNMWFFVINNRFVNNPLTLSTVLISTLRLLITADAIMLKELKMELNLHCIWNTEDTQYYIYKPNVIHKIVL